MEVTGTIIADASETASHPYQTKVNELSNLVARRLPAFQRMALRQLGNREDAEDAVQDAFLSAYTHLHQFKGQAQMATWLTTIVINSSRMMVRRRRRRFHIPLDGQEGEPNGNTFAESLSDRRPSPEEACRRREMRERLVQLSTQLSPKLRSAFQLHVVDGLSIRETAAALGLQKNTVKSEITRARAILKRFEQESRVTYCRAA